MKTPKKSKPPTAEAFIQEAGSLATEFGWRAKTSERENEAVVVALTESEPTFERFVWVYNFERASVRCMLVSKEKVAEKRQTAILELCARVNEALPFGCLEYSFSDRVLVFRDATDVECGPLKQVIIDTTSRVINLGRRYDSAITSTLAGEQPEVAVKNAESSE
ncbi:MAG TPA: hypothetical protein VJU86_21225 [Pyrinomonadaceae bacterium]|nr:hypothetical protein [Pyrinomonadaceae bacterium]